MKRKVWALGYKWSSKEINFLKQNYSKKGVSWCAEKLNRTKNSVQIKGKKLGLRIDKKGHFYRSFINKLSKDRLGNLNPNWKEKPKVPKNTGHARAQRLFPQKPCHVCKNTKTERHHVDGNTLNNSIKNIMFLCRKHHMEEDGRLEKLVLRNKNGKNGRFVSCLRCKKQFYLRLSLIKLGIKYCSLNCRRNNHDQPDKKLLVLRQAGNGSTDRNAPCKKEIAIS